MKEIKRYSATDGLLKPTDLGPWCKWVEVEALQKELEDVRSLALAAVQLIPNDTQLGELSELRVEAREVFLGKDKEHIAKLQDRVAVLESDLRQGRAQHRETGVALVFGRKKVQHVDYPLSIFRIDRDEHGNACIGVYLP